MPILTLGQLTNAVKLHADSNWPRDTEHARISYHAHAGQTALAVAPLWSWYGGRERVNKQPLYAALRLTIRAYCVWRIAQGSTYNMSDLNLTPVDAPRIVSPTRALSVILNLDFTSTNPALFFKAVQRLCEEYDVDYMKLLLSLTKSWGGM